MNPILQTYRDELRRGLEQHGMLHWHVQYHAAVRFYKALFERHGDAVLNHIDAIVTIRKQAEKKVMEEAS